MDESSQLEEIVVGVDGSPASIEALREARRIAKPLNAGIRAITCWDLPAVIVTTETETFRDNADEILRKSVHEAFGTNRPANLRTVLVRGPARQSLIEASKGARMLVVGRRGYSRLGGWFVGSVSSACVARAHCPVLVVQTPEQVQSA